MSYVNETTAIFDESKTQATKKEKYGFASLIVLALCLTSFMAGHASSSAATASALRSNSGALFTQWEYQQCHGEAKNLQRYCDWDTYVCFDDAGINGDFSKCSVPADPKSSSCEWAIDKVKTACYRWVPPS